VHEWKFYTLTRYLDTILQIHDKWWKGMTLVIHMHKENKFDYDRKWNSLFTNSWIHKNLLLIIPSSCIHKQPMNNNSILWLYNFPICFWYLNKWKQEWVHTKRIKNKSRSVLKNQREKCSLRQSHKILIYYIITEIS
jgi:hypothetical protein